MITVKQLLESEKRLAHFIDQIEGDRGNVPAGAFQFLTTAEGELQNRRAKLEQAATCDHPNVKDCGGGWRWCLSCGERWKEE